VLAEPVMLENAPFSATCSIGVSVFPQHGNSADALLRHADAAMYLAKKGGRNKIEFYPGDLPC
jgi:diguanylate cyclase (GGDEF)-like protein